MLEQAVSTFTTAISGFGTGLATSAVNIFDTAIMNGEQMTSLGEFGFIMLAFGVIVGTVGWAASKVG